MNSWKTGINNERIIKNVLLNYIMSSSVSYGLIIPKIYKSRNIILDILKSRGYNIEDYENFSVSDVLAMYNAVPKQLDMLLTNENNNKIYVKYHLNTVPIYHFYLIYFQFL